MELRRVLNGAGFRIERIGSDPYAWEISDPDCPTKFVEAHIEDYATDENYGVKVFIPTEAGPEGIDGITFDLPEAIRHFMAYLEDHTRNA